MGVLSKILGNFVPGHQLEYNNKSYTFSLITDEHQALISKAWYRHLRAQLKSYHDDGEYDSTELARLLAELRQQDMMGKFELSNPYGVQMLDSKDGQLIILQTILGIDRLEAQQLLKAKMVEVKDLLVGVYFESFPDLKEKALSQERGEEKSEEKSEAQKKS